MRRWLPAFGEFLLGNEGPATLRHRLLAGVAGLLSLRVAFGAMAFLLSVLLARLLGRSGMGVYSYALAWVTVLGAPAILGMDQLLVREIPAYALREEWGLLRGVLRVASRVVMATSAGLILVAIAVSWILRAPGTHDTLPTLWLALMLVPLIALTRVRQGTLQGLHRVVVGTIPERLVLPAALLGLLVAAKLLNVHVTAPVAMALNVTATIAAFSLGAWLMRGALPLEVRVAAPVYRTAAWVRAGFPILLLNSVGVVMSQSDLLIVGAVKGAAVVGLYGVADKSADLLSFVLLAQGAAFASTASSLFASDDLVALQRLTTRIARLTLMATLVPAVIMIAFGHRFLGFFYGAEFATAGRALAILAVGQLVNVTAGLNGMLLIMGHRPGEAVKAVAASAATNVALNLVMVPRWGMEGAAVANTISLVVLNVLATYRLFQTTGLDSTVFGLFRNPVRSIPARPPEGPR